MTQHDSLEQIENEDGVFFVDTQRDVKIAQKLKERDPILNTIDRFSGDLAVDVGAHIGTITVPLARRFKRVLAFEPMSAQRTLLGRNLAANKLTNVTIHSIAVGSRAGELGIVRERAGNSGGTALGVGEDIQVTTLDTVIHEPVDFIKIDVEGMEWEVLKGARNLILKYRPVLCIELNRTTPRFTILKMWLFLKYNRYRIEGRVVRRSTGDILAIPKKR